MKSGILLFYKNPGKTSFGALGRIKKRFETKKVGHAGTLDKFASGLLILLIGRATKLNSYFSGLDKSYLATLELGIETDTLDPEGEILQRAEVPSYQALQKILPSFKGGQEQVPPVYSAIHVQGKRAYQRVRSGEHVEMTPRNITIHEINPFSMEKSQFVFEVSCSKGTYIRALGRDIAKAAGSCGFLSALERTSIGPFSIKNWSEKEKEEGLWMNTDEALMALGLRERRTLKEDYQSFPLDGRTLEQDYFDQPIPEGVPVLIYNQAGFICLVELNKSGIKYLYMEKVK